MSVGRVYLVGAGPGEPGLITLRGAELLEQADCVIYDSLANAALLERVPARAELINVGKRSGAHSFTQSQINELLIRKAAEHRAIVRLKGGDPGIFGRAAEEARALAGAGIDFEIVPGVTAATAAAEYAGVVLTDRDHSSQVLFVTGREAEGKETSGIDWDILARFSGSIAFYMGVGNLGDITARLLEKGMAGTVPVCIVENATFPQQRVVRGCLSDIVAKAADAAVASPAIIIIGRAAAGDASLDWFSRRPLKGMRILLTRDVRGNRLSAEKVRALGGVPVCFETIRFKRLTEQKEFIAAIARLASYDWLVFTSERGVEAFFESIAAFGRDARVLGHIKVACVGTETSSCLARFGVRADFIPTVFTGAELARQLIQTFDVADRRMLLLRSAISEPALADLLKAAGANVDDIACYTSQPAESDPAGIIASLKQGGIDWVTFTSSSAVRGFFAAVEPALLRGSRAKVASIGPVTSSQLHEYGAAVTAEAAASTFDGLLAAIVQSGGPPRVC
ncbi:MAG TPA: uroporphyrinogen-III C-methyltransferase [Sedimentisphaerales bacterium]|nr:uroporphyrinogen-III C-methyltransferase [Sedimentisphaerales bacterium]